MSGLRNRILFHARAYLCGVSRHVEWVDTTMYDSEEKVARYDTANTERPLSTFKSPIELEFLDMIPELGIRSVLDLGCGAGAFYHLLSSVYPDVRYHGYDLSKAQVSRARQRFGEFFDVRDIATIEQSEFSQFDAVHIYSVLSFMAVPDQIEVLQRILRSGAKLLTETGCTIPDVRYAPQSCFKDFSGQRDDGRTLFTAISFPFRSQIETAVAGTGHRVTFVEDNYGSTPAVNGSRRAGGVLAEKAALKRKHSRFDRISPRPKQWRLLKAQISPSDWTECRSRDYSAIPSDAVQSVLMQKLSPTIGRPPGSALFRKDRIEEGRAIVADQPVIWIYQPPRSGGTMFLRLFDGHPQMHVHPAPIQFRWPRKSDPEKVLEKFSMAKFTEQGFAKSASNRSQNPVPIEFDGGVYRAIFEAKRKDTPRQIFDAAHTACFNAWRNYRAVSGDKRYVMLHSTIWSQTPVAASMANFLSAYPEGWTVFIARNPADWIASGAKLHGSKLNDTAAALKEYVASYSAFLESPGGGAFDCPRIRRARDRPQSRAFEILRARRARLSCCP